MRITVVAVLLTVALAGCSDGDVQAAPEPERFQDARATSVTGVIRGIIVDETVTPVPDVQVVLSPGGLETRSDVDGAFVFGDLDPGVYFLQTRAELYTDVQTSAEVVAGDDTPPVTRIQVERLQPPEPFIQAYVWQAFMETSVSVAGEGVVVGGFTGQGTFRTTHDLPGNVSWVQSELVWDPEQLLADTMQIDARLHGGGREQEFMRVIGPSALLQLFDDETVHPDTDQVEFVLFVEDSSLVPAGLTLQQRLTMFTHSFHHFTPAAEWRFTTDGDHGVPDG